jgi:hypothetical protein
LKPLVLVILLLFALGLLLLGIVLPAQAAITVTVLDSGSITTSNTIVTNSVSPPSGMLLLLWVGLNTTGCETTSAVAGLGVTWTDIARSASGQTTARGYRAISIGNTGAITITYGGTNANCVATLWTLLGLTGVDTTTNQGIVTTRTSLSGIVGSPAQCTASLGTYAASGNATVGAYTLVNGALGATFTKDVDPGWVASTAINLANATFATQWLLVKGSDTIAIGTMTWAGATSNVQCVTAEIAALTGTTAVRHRSWQE